MKSITSAQIDILAFVKDGTFDVLKTGQTRDWVLGNFPLPDDFDNGESYRHGEFEIFNYGDFELHFSHDILFLIFADYEGQLESGKSLRLTQKWIFERDTSELSLPYVMQALKDEGIGFEAEKNDSLFSLTLKLDSKVELHFESDESYDLQDYGFVGFWIMDRALLRVSDQ
ncbi:MAG: hypothetical protein ABJN69_08025 [Hellea sp.]